MVRAAYLSIPIIISVGMAAAAWAQEASSVSSETSLTQVAYLKASNAEAYDHFGCGGAFTGHTGNSVAISRDGGTMAVGAPYESSGATGINGDQDDNSVYGSATGLNGDQADNSASESGAVYIFTY